MADVIVSGIAANEEIETNVVLIKNLSVEQESIDEQIKELQAKKKALAEKEETLRNEVKESLNGSVFESDFCKISYGSSKSLAIDDIAAIPEKYLEVVAPKPDKKAIKKALENGEEIKGAHIEVNSFLKIAFK